MCDEKNPPEDCRSIFQNGSLQITAGEYTNFWIHMINQLERRKGGTVRPENDPLHLLGA